MDGWRGTLICNNLSLAVKRGVGLLEDAFPLMPLKGGLPEVQVTSTA
jgi:hypothetical protein